MKRDLLWLAILGGVALIGAATLINLTNQVTGVLPHANGGTDVSSAGANGNVLTSNGTNWTSAAAPSGAVSSVSGTTNQVSCSPTTGAVVCGFTSTIIIPNGSTATTQSIGDNTTDVATDAFVIANAGGSGTGFPFSGNGQDGAVIATGSGTQTCIGTASTGKYTLTRDCFFTTFEVQSGATIETAQWRIFAQISITNDVGGVIDNSGLNASASTSTASQGGANGCGGNTSAQALPTPNTNVSCVATGGASGVAGGTAGGTVGNTGSGGRNGSNSICTSQFSPTTWNSGAGGNGSGGTGGGSRPNGSPGSFTLTIEQPKWAPLAIAMWPPNGATAATTYSVCNESGGAASGGSGGGDGTAGGASGFGGGNGGPGGFMVLVAPTISNSGTIQSNGGNGAAGNNGSNAAAGSRGGGGGGAGGAGGNGGVISLVYHALTAGTITVNGGSGGNGGTHGTGTGTGTNGTDGQNGPTGNTGVILELAI